MNQSSHDSVTCSDRNREPFGRRRLGRASALILMFTCLATQPVFGADEPGLGDRAATAVQETTAAVQEAGRTVAADAGQLWQRIDAARLKNRTPDEIVAWVIMGLLVGAVAGMMTSLKPGGLGKLGRVLLGLGGAFLGGIVVRITDLDFGWGPVLIRYEELFISFLGAIVLIALGRLVGFRSKKKVTAK
jgi:uncharacterized membrane protein YeaQ/YmgE (transglycosylase-associated protein family)